MSMKSTDQEADGAAWRSPSVMSGEENLKGIREVAKLLDVTPRTLRFYEDKALIAPVRIGTTRIYSRRDVGRMQVILRGKRLGFTLREIREYLDLYDVDPKRIEQMERLLANVRERLEILQQQQSALEQTIGELKLIEREAAQKIAAANRK